MSTELAPELSTDGNLINESSISASVTSRALHKAFCALVGIHVVADNGTHVGNVKFQVSNDGTNWDDYYWKNNTDDVKTLNVALANGSTTNKMIDIYSGAKYLRAVFTRSSGAGTLTVRAIRIGDT